MKLILRTLRCAHPSAPKTKKALYPHEWNPSGTATFHNVIDAIIFLNSKSAEIHRQAREASWI